MDKTFYEMIFKRKSFHIFRNVRNESISDAELDDIQNAYTAFIPLNPEIQTTIHIIPEKQTNCKRGGEYCILLYSEKKNGYLQNIGYLGEQLGLYLVSRNIGTLWFGINKVTGCLLFLFPLTLTFIDMRHSAVFVCFIATAAAIYEGYLIQAGKTT